MGKAGSGNRLALLDIAPDRRAEGGDTVADLISRAAAIERMKSMAGCATCDNYNYLRCRACIWDDAMNIVDEAPTIKAISVGWLIDRANDPERAPLYRRYAQMLYKEWQDEQEAR